MSRTKEHLMKMEAEAQALGWADLAQMEYYENLAETEFIRSVQELPAPPPSIFIHELDKMDPREIYGDEGVIDIPVRPGYNTLAGVY